MAKRVPAQLDDGTLWAPARLADLASVLAELPRPLSLEAARLDLTYLDALVRLGLRRRIPGWKVLVHRWGGKASPRSREGWSRTAVEALLADRERWAKPGPAKAPRSAERSEALVEEPADDHGIRQISGGRGGEDDG